MKQRTTTEAREVPQTGTSSAQLEGGSPPSTARSVVRAPGKPEREAFRSTLWARFGLEPGDESRNALVEEYQSLVTEVVRRFAARLPRNVDRGDLQTAANVGLMAAVASFDPSRGVPFEAYGERRIKGALLDELRTQDWLPRPWRQRIEQHKRAVESLRAELGRRPRDAEVAEYLELSVGDYQALFGTGFPGAPSGGGVSAESDDDDPFGALGFVPDTRSDAPDVRLTREELLGLVAQRLTEQEYRIVYLKYWEELPMREIGQLTGLSESRVCKIHARLIDRLQERLGRLQTDAT
ncbi:MAG: sigma-70 family RNA polymerase sigma factor [Planctomycetota bacterium]|jgi:RNA polymerase sigma factor for flagellar operon FliA